MMFKHLLLVASFLASCFMHAANAQVPALYGATDVFSWYRLQAAGNTVSLGPDQIKQINAGNYATYPDGASGDLKAVTRAKVPIGNASLVVDVVGKIPKASLAKALGNFAFKVAAPVQVGVAIWDLVSELKMMAAKDAAGVVSFSKKVDVSGLVWRTDYTDFIFYSMESACQSLQTPGSVFQGYSTTYSGGPVCNVDYPQQGYGVHSNLISRAGPSSTVIKPVSRQDFEDAIATQSGWPSSSSIGQATRDAINSGESVTVEPVTVTGPATTPGPRSSTTTSARPATATTAATPSVTTTVSTTNNYHYDGNTITVTNTTTTEEKNNDTGEVKTTTAQITPEVKAPRDPKPDDMASDTPLADIPALYKPVYPRGLEGVWADQKAAMAGSSLARLIPSLMPNVGNSGQCPTMPINLNLSGWANFGTVDVAPPCFLWDFGKVVIIMSALLLARGLVFGG